MARRRRSPGTNATWTKRPTGRTPPRRWPQDDRRARNLHGARRRASVADTVRASLPARQLRRCRAARCAAGGDRSHARELRPCSGIASCWRSRVAGVDAATRAAPKSRPRPKVILLRPPAAPSGSRSRRWSGLRGELMLEGFDAAGRRVAAGRRHARSLEMLAPTMAATAVVAVVGGRRSGSAELWVVDRVTGKTVVRRIRADPDRPRRAWPRSFRCARSSCCARASSSWRSPRTRSADTVDAPVLPATPVVTRFATEPLIEAEPDWKWAVEAGGGRHRRGVGRRRAGGAGAGRARRARAWGAAVRARDVRGPGDAVARRHPGGGYADVSQTVVLAEALVRFRRGRRLEPMVSVGAGVFRLAAEGHVAAPYTAHRRLARGRRRPTWASACGAVAPAAARAGHRGARASWRSRIPCVRFFDEDVARAGRPSLLRQRDAAGGNMTAMRAGRSRLMFAAAGIAAASACTSAPIDVAILSPDQPDRGSVASLDVRRGRGDAGARQLGERTQRHHLGVELELDYPGKFGGALQFARRRPGAVGGGPGFRRRPPATAVVGLGARRHGRLRQLPIADVVSDEISSGGARGRALNVDRRRRRRGATTTSTTRIGTRASLDTVARRVQLLRVSSRWTHLAAVLEADDHDADVVRERRRARSGAAVSRRITPARGR